MATLTRGRPRRSRSFLQGLKALNVSAGASLTHASSINADLFAGGGGASLGIELALGQSPHIAVNHDRAAIEMHCANHPDTLHYTEDVWKVNPRLACCGLPIGLLWASPDCRHFSKAKGGKPVSKRIRSLAWIVVKWAKLPRWQRPRVIFLENVEEFLTWGPLMRDPRYPGADKWIPDPRRKGEIFRRWRRALEDLGYIVEHRVLNAADYGVPTVRKRLFLVARCDGRPITWPKPTHTRPDKQGRVPKGLKPWVPVYTCLDFGLPCPSIFDAAARKALGLKTTLAEKTLERVARGVARYVIATERPFLIRIGHWPADADQKYGFRGQGLDEPLGTVTGVNDKAIVSPVLTRVNHGVDQDRSAPVTLPLHTITGRHGTGLASAVMTRVGNNGSNGDCVSDIHEPLRTVVSKNQDNLVQAFLQQYAVPHVTKFRQNSTGSDVQDPLPTITSGAGSQRPAGAPHALGLVSAVVNKYYGSSKTAQPVTRPLDVATTKARFGLTTATIVKHNGGVVGHTPERPLGTVTAVDHHSVVESTLAPLTVGTSHTGTTGRGRYQEPVTEPLKTITGANDKALVAANLVHLNHGNSQWSSMDDPARTVTAQGNHAALVQSLLQKHAKPVKDPTLAAKIRHGLVTLMDPETGQVGLWQIVDIGMRMLQPPELLNAQFHPEVAKHYKMTGSKASQVARIGNSVPPLVVRALVKANYVPAKGRKEKACR